MKTTRTPSASGHSRRQFISGLGAGAAALWLAAGIPLARAQNASAAAGIGQVRISPLQAFNFLTLAQLDGLIDTQVSAQGGKVDWKPAFPAYVPTAEALRGGSIDIGSGSSTAFLTATGADSDLLVFAVERSSGQDQGIVATNASGIKSIPDLVGKKVAVNQGGTGEYLLHLALARHNIPVSQVQVVYLGPTDAATAFIQQQVDAWAVWEQFFALGQAQPGARVITYASDIGSLNRNVHVTTRRFASEHPLLVKAVFEAMRQEADAVRAKPGLVADLNQKAGVPLEVADIIRRIPPSTLAAADPVLQQEFVQLADFYAQQKLSPDRIAVRGTLFNVQTGEIL